MAMSKKFSPGQKIYYLNSSGKVYGTVVSESMVNAHYGPRSCSPNQVWAIFGPEGTNYAPTWVHETQCVLAESEPNLPEWF